MSWLDPGEMANSTTDGEPTMEEILSSIRKIISEDEPQAEKEAAEAEAAPAGMAQAEVEEIVDEVLELTDRVEEGAGNGASEEQEIDAILTTVTDAPAEEEMEELEQNRSTSGGLLSTKTDSAVTSTLAGFFDEMVKEKTPPEARTGPSPTLDDVVREMLAPYLKSWLDENLEPIVERTVRDELKRLARRAEDL
ncbi:MAG: DUF2497 domain-containing protein [Kiloniellales bacterium]|nr:DUF2497 domain-containing protein [Kiloniellales bacterium]